MHEITHAVLGRAIAKALTGMPVAAAFVYGSVAAGTDRSGSDIDTFVLLTTEIEEQDRKAIRDQFARLQQQLGYQPDHDHPVELFTVDTARAALDLVELAVVDGCLSGLPLNGDEREVLGALTGPRLLIRGGTHLDQLTARAVRLNLLVAKEVTA